MVLVPLQSDRFVWKWSPDEKYSASSAYRTFFNGSTELLGAKELWQTKAPPHVKFFFWLALHQCLWTTKRRKRHGLQDNDACVLCGQKPETYDHLFLGCVVTRQLWLVLLSPIRLKSITPHHDDEPADWWLRSRGMMNSEAGLALDSALLLIAWCVWKERNNRTFKRSEVGL
jgi:hypothetical protein